VFGVVSVEDEKTSDVGEKNKSEQQSVFWSSQRLSLGLSGLEDDRFLSLSLSLSLIFFFVWMTNILCKDGGYGFLVCGGENLFFFFLSFFFKFFVGLPRIPSFLCNHLFITNFFLSSFS
jgi:hypothetical protein